MFVKWVVDGAALQEWCSFLWGGPGCGRKKIKKNTHQNRVPVYNMQMIYIIAIDFPHFRVFFHMHRGCSSLHGFCLRLHHLLHTKT